MQLLTSPYSRSSLKTSPALLDTISHTPYRNGVKSYTSSLDFSYLFSDLPAIASCMMKKFIRLFLDLVSNSASTTVALPATMPTSSTHKIANWADCVHAKNIMKLAAFDSARVVS